MARRRVPFWNSAPWMRLSGCCLIRLFSGNFPRRRTDTAAVALRGDDRERKSHRRRNILARRFERRSDAAGELANHIYESVRTFHDRSERAFSLRILRERTFDVFGECEHPCTRGERLRWWRQRQCGAAASSTSAAGHNTKRGIYSDACAVRDTCWFDEELSRFRRFH